MANTSKKASAAEVKEVETKAAASEVKTEAPKAEKKTEAKKPAKKPAAKKEAAPKAAPAAIKETAPKTEKKAEPKKSAKKPAAKKAAAPKAEKKPAGKAAAKKADEKPAAKRGGRKKSVSYDNVFTAAKSKVLGANTTRIKYPIAANVELNGAAEGIFYICINPDEQSIAVEPYKYNDYDVEIRADAEKLLEVLSGKKNVYDALADGDMKIGGNIKKAILLINAAF